MAQDVILRCKGLEGCKEKDPDCDFVCGDPCLLNCDFDNGGNVTDNGWGYCGELILEPNPDKFITIETALKLAKRTLQEDLKRRQNFKKSGMTYTNEDKPEDLTIMGILKTMREK